MNTPHSALTLPLALFAALPAGARNQNPAPLHTFTEPGLGFGSSAASGPVDTDALADLVIGSPDAVTPAGSNAGRVSVYAGATQTLLWSVDGTSVGARSGASVAVAEDMNGDGWGEVLVGSPRETNAGGTEVGRVQVLSGLDGSQLLEVTGTNDFDSLGAAVAGLSDFDGDGTPDFAAGAPTQGAGTAGDGRVLILSGADGSVLATLLGNDPGWGDFGRALARTGDVDGDGVDDLAVGEPFHDGVAANAGRVAIHSGADGALLREAEGDVLNARLGWSVAGAGDLDGDGRADWIAGAVSSSSPGRARIYSGQSGAMIRELAGTAVGFGVSVAGLGDFDGDATADVIVGTVDVLVADPGTAQVFSGACGRLLAEYRGGTSTGHRLGFALAGVGDIDGDTLADAAVGAPGANEVTLERGYARPPALGYCTAGLSASGCQALVSGTGTPSASAPSGFDLQAAGVPGGASGIFYFGANGRQARPWAGGVSFQCVVPPVQRTGLQPGNGTAGACDGSFTLDLNAYWSTHPHQAPGAGGFVQVQLWYRDPLNTGGLASVLSNAVELSLCP